MRDMAIRRDVFAERTDRFERRHIVARVDFFARVDLFALMRIAASSPNAVRRSRPDEQAECPCGLPRNVTR